ncbi:hypothetical protein B0T22DRAFT_439744 [Podospora appendiculata]|uniref:MARVEL domain-containing protein n=1 Tax=Podospora appendiculata TaxID=314037 RepID=A0AAE0X9J7_9PEZI|nr:hypothetical protein B0T22DRAFT_439744 [Podospora appendiculata]
MATTTDDSVAASRPVDMAGEQSNQTRQRATATPADVATPSVPQPPLPPAPQHSQPMRPLPPPHPKSVRQQEYERAVRGSQPLQPPVIRVPLPFSKKWRNAKLFLATVSIICSILIIAVAIAAGAISSRDFYYDDIGDINLGISGTAAGLALVWLTADLLVITCTRHRRGMHPGAQVAFHLIIWLIALNAAVFSGIFVDYAGYYPYWYSSQQTSTLQGLRLTTVIFTILLTLIHFILFVRACIETHKVNTIGKIIWIPVGEPTGYAYPHVPYPGAPQYPHPVMNGVPMKMPPLQPGQQGNGPPPPQQPVLYSGYYAPAPQPVSSGVWQQPPQGSL